MAARTRLAVGACMLSAGFLFSGAGGAVALADAGSQDSSARTTDAAPAADSAKTVLNTQPDTVAEPASTLDSSATASTKPADASSAADEPESMAITGDDSTTGTVDDGDLDTAAAVVGEDSTGSEDTSTLSGVQPSTSASIPESAALQPVSTPQPMAIPDVTAPTESAAAPLPTRQQSPNARNAGATTPAVLPDPRATALSPVVGPDAARMDPVTLVTRAIASLEDVVGAVGEGVFSIPALLVSLPTSATPISDVITAIQKMLTSIVTAATPLVRLPSDFASMFLVATGPTPAVIGVPEARSHGVAEWGRPPAEPALLPQTPAAPGDHVAGSTGDPAPRASHKTIAASMVGHHVAPSSTAPSDQRVTLTGGLPAYLKRIADTLLVPVSLWALVTAAVPGIAGLLTFGFIGVRIGYRQAKANFVLRASAMGRFAGSGPLGVVRSGSLVMLHPRLARSVSPMRWQDQAA